MSNKQTINIMAQKTLTLSEAKELGYEHYLIEGMGWGALLDISGLDPSGEGGDWCEDLVLADKDFREVPTPDASIISGMIAEMIADFVCENSEMGDTEDLYNGLMRIKYEDVIGRIGGVCGSIRYKLATGIRLVPDGHIK